MEKLKELQDLAIWMSGCGYDFTQHEHFLKNKHLLTDEAINYTHSCKSDSEQFPSFLYKHEGGLYFKHLEDTDITDQWNEYLKTR